MAAAFVLTTPAPQNNQLAQLMAANRPPWPVGTTPGAVEFTPWDFVFRSIDDLAPFASGGNFVLPTGSYAWAAPINVGVAQVQVTGTVLFGGFGIDKVLSGSNPVATLSLLTNANFRADSFAVAASAGSAVLVTAAASRTARCSWTAPNGASAIVSVNSAASWRDIQSQYTGGNGGIDTGGTGGIVELDQCNLDFTSSNGVRCNGASTTIRLARTRLNGRIPIRMNTAGRLFLDSCQLDGTSGQPALLVDDCAFIGVDNSVLVGSGAVAIQLNGGSQFQMRGGRIATGGVVMDGGYDGLLFDGVFADGGSTFFEWVSGAVSSAQFNAVRTGGGVTNGIDWAAASLPTRALQISNCSFGSNPANAFLNFTETDAGVNVKNCSAAGTLLPETPIVP